jgi:asparagine synthetase B (glutamine-hydrolysing)
VHPLSAPITTDAFGTSIVYYATIGGRTLVSGSVAALARQLGTVTVNPRALAEILSFGFILRDETVLQDVRSIPPHTTLNIDGTLTTHDGPHARGNVKDGDRAAARLRALLEDVIRRTEPTTARHCAGFTGGKDSRLRAALPKGDAGSWHWLTVSGRDDAEHAGSAATARQLGLGNVAWLEWTSDFLAGDAYRESADLANGVGAVSDHTLLRSAFDRHRRSTFGDIPAGDAAAPALWIGTLADGLFAGTYAAPGATTLNEALTPRTAHLPNLLSDESLETFRASQSFFDSNPFAFSSDRGDDTGWFIRLLTRGRLYVCRSLSCFDHWPGPQINPYLDPEMIDLALMADISLLRTDALRDGALRSIAPGLDGKSAFGYKAPAYSHHVFRALAVELPQCGVLDRQLARAPLDAMRSGVFPDLNPSAEGTSVSAAPAYRVHGAETQPVIRSLRDYEHLLVYTAFINQLDHDGVVIR